MRRVVLSLCAWLWLSCAVAGDKPEFGPVPPWVQPTVLPPDDGVVSDAAVRFLLTDWQFNFSAAGDEAYFDSVVRVQTPQGLAAVGTLTLPWNPGTDTLTVHKVHIIRGGQVIDVLASGQTFTVLRRENSLEYATLNGVLTAVIQPAGLQVGDTIELAFSLKRSNPVLAGISEWIVYGWPNVPIAHLRVRGHWTAPASIRWKANDSMTGVQETRSGEATEVSVVLDNPAPLLPPHSAPARYRIGRQIEFSSFKSWAQVAEELAPLFVRAATLTPQSALNAEIARMRAASSDSATRAMAALGLVQDQVRYVFLGMNEGALVPADAELTWSRRFGDCKGKTALLLALLHGLDIDAEPVAVNTLNGDSIKSGLPMVDAFNHVLVRAVIGGKAYWLDGARSGDKRLDELSVPPYYWGLPLVPKGGELVQIVPTPLTQPSDDTSIHIDAAGGIPGSAPVHAETVFRGETAARMRLGLGNLAPADREQALRKFWSKVLAAATIESVAARFDEQTAQEHLTMDGSTHMEWAGGRYKIEGLAITYNADLTRVPGPHSDAPFIVQFPTYSHVVETITLPHAQGPFTVEGNDIQSTTGGSEFSRKVRIADGVLTAEESTRSLVPEVPFAGAQDADKALHEFAGSSVYLRAASGLGAADKRVAAAGSTPADPVGMHIRLGNDWLNRREYDKAIGEFDTALQLDPVAALALADRGMAHMWKEERELARVDFDKAVAIDPRNAVVPRGRGMLALGEGRFTEAAADFTDSLALAPNNTFTLQWRAEAYRQSGDYEKALADSATAIRLQPGSFGEYVFRASVLRGQARVDQALQQADAVVATNPADPGAYVAAAEIYWASGKDAQAMQSLERSLTIAPTVQAYLVRARYRPRADLAGRRADAEAALALDFNSTPVRILLANVQSDAREYDGAVLTLNKAMSIHGETPELLTWRGIAYAKSNQPALAAGDFAAARLKATSAGALNTMCWNMATSGVAFETALSACDAAVAQAPNDSQILDSRGFVLLRLGRYDDAITSYDAALKAAGDTNASLYGRGVAKDLRGGAVAGEADIKSALALNAHVATTFADYGVKP
jgi:tetratricopeptide (TPR) repeat protein/transglutaminase-like putative cysteine protease